MNYKPAHFKKSFEDNSGKFGYNSFSRNIATNRSIDIVIA